MGASEIETQKSQGLATSVESKNQEIEFAMADKLLNEIRRTKSYQRTNAVNEYG